MHTMPDDSEKTEPIFICSSTESLDSWASNELLPEEIQTTIREANVLVVPFIGHAHDSELVYFPKGTDVLMDTFRAEATESFRPDI